MIGDLTCESLTKCKKRGFQSIAKLALRIIITIEITRLTYNCAHLRLTKESLTFEYFDTGPYWLVLGGTWSVEDSAVDI